MNTATSKGFVVHEAGVFTSDKPPKFFNFMTHSWVDKLEDATELQYQAVHGAEIPETDRFVLHWSACGMEYTEVLDRKSNTMIKMHHQANLIRIAKKYLIHPNLVGWPSPENNKL